MYLYYIKFCVIIKSEQSSYMPGMRTDNRDQTPSFSENISTIDLNAEYANQEEGKNYAE